MNIIISYKIRIILSSIVVIFFICESPSQASVEVGGAQGSNETANISKGVANDFLPSPYKACSEYKILLESEFNKDKINWQEKIKKDPKIQVIPDPGMMANKFEEDSNSMEFLLRLTERSLKEITRNTENQRQGLLCYHKSFKQIESSQEQLSSECRKLISVEMQKHNELLDKARMELALSEGNDLVKISHGQRLGWEIIDPAKMINSSLKELSWLDSTVRAKDLQELNSNESKIAKEQFIAESFSLRKSISEHEYADVENKLAEIRNRHKIRYLELLQEDPLLLTVGSKDDGSKDSKTKIYEGKKKLVELAGQAQAAVKETLLHPKPKTKLLANMVFTPIVEALLREQKINNPKVCGTAASLYYSMQKSDSIGRLREIGALALGEFGASSTLGFLVPPIEIGVGAVTLPAVLIGMVALGPGLYYLKTNADKLDIATGAMVGKIGTGEDLDSKNKERDSSIASIPLDIATLGVGSAVGRIFRNTKAAPNIGIKLNNDLDLLRTGDVANSAAALKRIKAILSSKTYHELFGAGERPSQEELDIFINVLKLDPNDSILSRLAKLNINNRGAEVRNIIKTWKGIPTHILDNKVSSELLAFGIGQNMNINEISHLVNHWSKSDPSALGLTNLQGILRTVAANDGLDAGINQSGFRQAIRFKLETKTQFEKLSTSKKEELLNRYGACGKKIGVR